MELTLDEIARRLNLPAGKVERWISQGHIPIKRSGNRCVFSQSALEKWAETHHLSLHLQGLAEPVPADSVKSRSLLPAMKRGGVHYDVAGDDVASVLKTAVSLLSELSDAPKETLYTRLMEREALMSTGIGKGIAFPHPRTPLTDVGKGSILATFFLKHPVMFHSIDGRPVTVLFMLMCPTTQDHLSLLSRLAFCVRDDAFVAYLKTAPDADGLFLKIAEFEKLLDKT